MKKGIDVSTLQGSIDWEKINVDFAMIKATQGRGETESTKKLRVFTDPMFKENVMSADSCGIPVGCYHYFTATDKSEAVYEAEYFCRVIEPYRSKLKLWAAVDVESKYLDRLKKDELTAVTQTFTDHVEKAGYLPMLYTNPNFIRERYEKLPDVDIWLAHWNVSKPMDVNRLKIWQKGIGYVDGVGNCDINVGYFASEEYQSVKEYKVGDKYIIKSDDRYSNGKQVPLRLVGQTFTVSKVQKDRILLSEIYSWVKI